MPNIRRLAWRDRRVWTLTQTMTGEGAGSPPFQFPSSGAGEFVVSMTEAEWVDVFSALMTGADLSYPDRSHQVVWNLLRNLEFPVSLQQYAGFAALFAFDWVVSVGGALSVGANTAAMLNMQASQATPAINDEIVNRTPHAMQAGGYAFTYLCARNPAYGIATFEAIHTDGTTVSMGTVDQYVAVAAQNFIGTGLFTLPKSGNWNFRKRMATKNASSTGYGSFFQALKIERVG